MWSIVKWPVLAVAVVLIIAILYYATPNAKQPKFRWISLGAVLAIVVLVILSAGFALYVANFSNYDRTYGSLAGVIVFLLWLWIANLALLFGAEFDAELERGRQLQAGIAAEEDIQLPPRDTRKSGQGREAGAEGHRARPPHPTRASGRRRRPPRRPPRRPAGPRASGRRAAGGRATGGRALGEAVSFRIPHRTRAPSARRRTMRITLRLVEIKRLSGRANRRDPRIVMTIVYAGEELMTGDEIAQALLKYSEALAGEGQRLDGGDPDTERRRDAIDGHGARRPRKPDRGEARGVLLRRAARPSSGGAARGADERSSARSQRPLADVERTSRLGRGPLSASRGVSSATARGACSSVRGASASGRSARARA